jgi:hypothetical protein
MEGVCVSDVEDGRSLPLHTRESVTEAAWCLGHQRALAGLVGESMFVFDGDTISYKPNEKLNERLF